MPPLSAAIASGEHCSGKYRNRARTLPAWTHTQLRYRLREDHDHEQHAERNAKLRHKAAPFDRSGQLLPGYSWYERKLAPADHGPTHSERKHTHCDGVEPPREIECTECMRDRIANAQVSGPGQGANQNPPPQRKKVGRGTWVRGKRRVGRQLRFGCHTLLLEPSRDEIQHDPAQGGGAYDEIPIICALGNVHESTRAHTLTK